MKTSTASHTLGVARTVAAIAAFTLASCAADDLTGEQAVASLTKAAPAMSAMPSGQQPCTGHESHILFLKDADGTAFRLVHIRGCGWKQVADGNTREDSLALLEMSFSPVAMSQAETTTATSDPMAVFIDGPTGYTFVWTGESGWKFVGYLSDEAH